MVDRLDTCLRQPKLSIRFPSWNRLARSIVCVQSKCSRWCLCYLYTNASPKRLDGMGRSPGDSDATVVPDGVLLLLLLLLLLLTTTHPTRTTTSVADSIFGDSHTTTLSSTNSPRTP